MVERREIAIAVNAHIIYVYKINLKNMVLKLAVFKILTNVLE